MSADYFSGRAARVRFVLVAPSHPGNIGAAARAIKTMGFGRLAVVAPRERSFHTHAEAIAFAAHAGDVLAAATVFASLAEALAGVTCAYAMTGYAREFGPRLVDLRSAAAETNSMLGADAAEVAFVFGTERSGLENEDVERCQACCAIPADPAHASLNLAQAVQITAYETRLALVGRSEVANAFAAELPAAVEQVEGMYAHLERALIALGYLDPEQPKRLMARLRRLLGRAQPTATEIDIVRGICAAIEQRKSDRAGRKVK
ncbi:MAG TPA: TrmJ/YjtD family RNA methyltransferase [Burkholderiaceae bacterium]|nr:TrmJ/YjtD family RNA methyltransferase [Burkholderiaceae bacterium]